MTDKQRLEIALDGLNDIILALKSLSRLGTMERDTAMPHYQKTLETIGVVAVGALAKSEEK